MQNTNDFPTLQRIQPVLSRTGLSRTTLYKLLSRGEFPHPVKISARIVAWDSEKVTAWIESRHPATYAAKVAVQ